MLYWTKPLLKGLGQFIKTRSALFSLRLINDRKYNIRKCGANASLRTEVLPNIIKLLKNTEKYVWKCTYIINTQHDCIL